MARFALTDFDRRLASLLGDDVYAIGGRVRDHFIEQAHGIPTASKDHDYVVVGREFDAVAERISGLGRIDAVGRSFAVVKLTTAEGETHDIAMARRERSTGTGHRDFAVDFGPEVSIREDALRRDFTFNAISIRLSDGEIIDAAGGVADIDKKLVRRIAPSSFADDPLRMLRAAQFASRFGFALDPMTADEIKSRSADLGSVSAERFAEEMTKLLMRSPEPSRGILLMRDLGLLDVVVPELMEGDGVQQNAFHVHDVLGHNARAADIAASLDGDLTDRFAALLHDVGKPRTVGVRSDGLGHSFHGHEDVGAVMARDILARLRFPSALSDEVAALTSEHMYAVSMVGGKPLSDAAIRRFIRKVGRGTENPELRAERVERQFTLRHADRHAGRPTEVRAQENAAFEARVRAELERAPVVSASKLEIDGNDVMRALVESGARPPGYRGDALVGQTLRHLLDIVVDEPALNQRQTLLEVVRKGLEPRNEAARSR